MGNITRYVVFTVIRLVQSERERARWIEIWVKEQTWSTEIYCSGRGVWIQQRGTEKE